MSGPLTVEDIPRWNPETLGGSDIRVWVHFGSLSAMRDAATKKWRADLPCRITLLRVLDLYAGFLHAGLGARPDGVRGVGDAGA